MTEKNTGKTDTHYSNSHMQISIIERIKAQAQFHPQITAPTMFHGFMSEITDFKNSDKYSK